MNYRHAFHAGNFADLVKHGAVTLIIDRLVTLPEPLLVVDTHAGAGLYDLGGEMALKSGEAEAGVLRLMADNAAPDAFRPLKAAVLNANRDGVIRVYPGSPVLIADRLRRDDEYIGAELRPDDFDILGKAMASSRGHARAVNNDGFSLLTLRAWPREDAIALPRMSKSSGRSSAPMYSSSRRRRSAISTGEPG